VALLRRNVQNGFYYPPIKGKLIERRNTEIISKRAIAELKENRDKYMDRNSFTFFKQHYQFDSIKGAGCPEYLARE
jgi:hypothetical protein